MRGQDVRAVRSRHERDQGAGGAPEVRRPLVRWVAVLLGVWHLGTACVVYVPAVTAPAPGTSVLVDLTDAGRMSQARALGPGVLRLGGTVRGATADRLQVDVTSVQPLRGLELPVTGIHVTLDRSDMAGTRVRTVSRARTTATIGAVVATVVAFFVTKGFRSGYTPPDGSKGTGGPDQ